MADNNPTEKRIRVFLEMLATEKPLGKSSERIIADRKFIARQLIKHFPEFFDPEFLKATGLRRKLEEDVEVSRAHGVLCGDVTDQDVEDDVSELILNLGYCLRSAWNNAEPRFKLWQGFLLRWKYHKTRGGLDTEAPERTPFDRAIEYFQSHWEATRVCNRIDCPNMKFFFRGKRDKRYCSRECSLEATRAVRRRSYHKRETARRNRGKKKA